MILWIFFDNNSYAFEKKIFIGFQRIIFGEMFDLIPFLLRKTKAAGKTVLYNQSYKLKHKKLLCFHFWLACVIIWLRKILSFFPQNILFLMRPLKITHINGLAFARTLHSEMKQSKILKQVCTYKINCRYNTKCDIQITQ